MAPHSSILAWEIPSSEEPDGVRPWGCKESEATEHVRAYAHTHTRTRMHTHTHTRTRMHAHEHQC